MRRSQQKKRDKRERTASEKKQGLGASSYLNRRPPSAVCVNVRLCVEIDRGSEGGEAYVASVTHSVNKSWAEGLNRAHSNTARKHFHSADKVESVYGGTLGLHYCVCMCVCPVHLHLCLLSLSFSLTPSLSLSPLVTSIGIYTASNQTNRLLGVQHDQWLVNRSSKVRSESGADKET